MSSPSKPGDARVPHPLGWKGAGVRVVRNPLVRYYGRGDLHFVTFSCYRRKPYLGTRRARDRFVRILDQVRRGWGFPLIGYVAMPEHVHLLVGEPLRGDLSAALQVLKQRTSRILRGKRTCGQQMSFRFSGEGNDAAHFWQRRFYDFNVWSAKKVREKLEYMHLNPVKRKLVSHPGDWPWSSWSYYGKGESASIASDPPETNKRATSSQHPHP